MSHSMSHNYELFVKLVPRTILVFWQLNKESGDR
jgi:hypothetical protein